jgi:hypothetical protein
MGLLFESSTCGRCGGTGSYSYSQAFGRTCFGCSGKGEKLTKRGEAAQSFYHSLLRLDRDDIKIGMRIHQGRSVFTVTEIDDESVHSAKCQYKGKGFEFHLYPSGEEKKAFIFQALEYQDTLTKAGKVRKRPKFL